MNQFTASLWGDEAWAATLAVKPVLKIIQIVAKDTSPPLYYFFLHFWLKIFGPSEVAIRDLSFLFFLATVLTVFLIGKHLWDKKTGLLASLLTLSNPFLFNYAFEGRMYSLLALTSTLSIYFFLTKKRLGFILASVAALYVHHFSIFIIFFEGLWRLTPVWSKPLKNTLRELADFLIIGALYLPWLYPLYYQTSLVAGGFWLGRPTFQTLFQTGVKFLAGSEISLWRNIALGAFIVVLALRRWLQKMGKSLFLLGWFLAPLVLTFVISQFFQPIFFDRYMLMVIPASALLIASLRRKLSLIFILIGVFSLLIINGNYFSHPTKKPFRELAHFIKQQAASLALVNYNATAHHLWESKYYGLEAPIYSPQPLPFYTGTALMEENDVIQNLPNQKQIGVIASAPVNDVIIPGYHLARSQQFGQLSFLWMEKD